MKISAVYVIKNLDNNMRYVGSSSNVRKRITDHFRFLRNGCHYNRHLQAAFNKHGEDHFLSFVVVYCAVKDLKKREQFWLDLLQAYDQTKGYNKARYTEAPNKGCPLSKEQKAKLRVANEGRAISDETRSRMSESHLGKKASRETREKQSLALKQQWKSGIRKGAPATEERKHKMSLVMKGRILSEGHKRSLSLSKHGKPLSPQHKLALKEAWKRRKERGKRPESR